MNTNMKHMLVLCMAGLGMIFSSCAVDDTMTGTGEIGGYEEFYVMDMTPGDKVTTSSQTNSLTVAFNMPIDSSTVVGNFALVQNVNGIPTNLTPYVTLSLDGTGSILTMHVNTSLPDKADFTLSMNQAVKSLGSGKFLRSAISHKFNTGGGFEDNDGSGSIPGKPYITSRNYIRKCYIDANGQEVHTAHIEVRFNEPLAFAPTVDVQKVNDLSSNWENKPMTQMNHGDLTLMKVIVDSVGGPGPIGLPLGYKIRFQHNFVRDWEGLFMDAHESSKMYQSIVQCVQL